MDGIDAALAEFGDKRCNVVATRSHAYPDDLRQRLKHAAVNPDDVGIDELGALDRQVGECFRDAALDLLSEAGVSAARITAIGSHGQTIRHLPGEDHPFSLQIGDPNIVALGTGITTVADFRRADLAAGGEGAPLTPAFHQWLFGDAGVRRVVLNLGGIANITVLADQADSVIGFDTGPGNTLMDAWMGETSGESFDAGGEFAAQGTVSRELLDALIQDPYFSRPPPKSTGFEYFNLEWLGSRFSGLPKLPAADVQATLAELTAQSIATAIREHAAGTTETLTCGGGVHNVQLMRRISRALPDTQVVSTSAHGLHPDWVEAVAFAWLAKRRLEGRPGNLPSATGAARAVPLGAVYEPAS